MKRNILRVGLNLILIISISLNHVGLVLGAGHEPSVNKQVVYQPITRQTTLADSDFDGITTVDEISGWFNDLGGPYYTDPNHPDTDFDGLSDGEEQLFDTDPTDSSSPGIFVKYTDDLHTAKYFVWQRHGDKIIANAQDEAKDAVIIRRGSSIFVQGPPGASLTVTSYDKANIGDITVKEYGCGMGWSVEAAPNGDVGIYTLKMTTDEWVKEMPLYVIFEIPNTSNSSNPIYSLNEDTIGVTLYNDDFEDIRDSHSIWWGTGENNGYARGRSIAFPTDQFASYVFENQVMPTIDGKSSDNAAIEAIFDHVDEITQFDASKPHYTMEDALNSTEHRNQCSNIANISTGFLRAAGIPARPENVDWDGLLVGSGVFDHATMVWEDNVWKTGRGYRYHEPCNESGNIHCGYNSPIPISRWGENKHKDKWGDIIYTSPDDWSWTTTGDQGDKETYPYGWDYIWTKAISDGVPSSGRFNGQSVDTWTVPYWGWPYEPIVTSEAEDPPWDGCPGRPCDETGQGQDGDDGSGDTDGVIFDRSLNEAQASRYNIRRNIAELGNIQSSFGRDYDGNGLFDELVVALEITVHEAGDYTFGASLNSDNYSGDNKLGAIAPAIGSGYFEPGTHIVELSFNGQTISSQEVDGPYVLTEVWLSATPMNVEPVELTENVVDYVPALDYVRYLEAGTNRALDLGEQTSADFEGEGAKLRMAFKHEAQDTNKDGLFDRITLFTDLNISKSGDYKVKAELVNSQGEVVSNAEWTGSSADVSLVFEGVFADTTAYYLQNIRLFNDKGETIDSMFNGYQSVGTYMVGPLYGLTRITRDPSDYGTEVVGATPVDSDNDGDYDSLDFAVNIVAPITGTYQIEAWLESATGSLVAWRTGDPTYLTAGDQTMSLSFDGSTIHAFSADGPYKLVSLKVSVLYNNEYTTFDEVNLAYETGALSFDEFDGEISQTVFVDRAENGISDLWDTNNTDWGLTTKSAYSPVYAWTDSPDDKYNSDTNAFLTTNPISVEVGAAPVIAFQSCYNIRDDGDQGKLQVRVDDGSWTTIDGSSYTGVSDNWVSETRLLLPPVHGTDTEMAFRFMMQSNSSGNEDGWYVDNIKIELDYDLDDDGLLNALEVGSDPENPVDSDYDTTPDYLDEDSDNDGISDLIEGDINSDNDPIPNYLDTDSDNDGILDEDEGTGDPDGDNTPNYLDTDSDNDGIPDGDGSNGTEGIGDPDGDNIPNYLDPDSDNDGLPDEWENENGTNPLVADSSGDPDNDGLTNLEEMNNGTDPLDDDSDDDGLTDEEEVNADNPTDPNDDDSDDDGLTDGEEVNAANPTDPNEADSDGDGLTDAEEINAAEPTNPNEADSDGDGVNDGDEVNLGLDPNEADSDGDGVDDGDEIGADPENPIDTDGDGVIDVLDEDDDNDDILSINEDLNGNGDFSDDDSDGDGIPNYLDNDNAPEASDDSYNVDEGQSLTVLGDTGVLVNDEDADADPITALLETDPVYGSLSLNSDGSFTYIHDGGETSADSFTYRVKDDDLNESNSATVDITINPVNDAPTALDNTYSVGEGATLVITETQGVLANDNDVENDLLTAVLIDNPAHGDLTLNSDGSFTYIHDGSETTGDSFVYEANDGQLSSNQATVTINIGAVNDAPVANNDAYNVDEGGSLAVGAENGLVANDSDKEGDDLTVTLIDEPAYGVLTLDTDGSFSYLHNGGEASSDSFTYQVTDVASNISNKATVQITINAINDVPVANDDTYTVNEGGQRTVSSDTGLLVNDSDAEDDTLTVIVVDDPAHGTLAMNADGSFIYIHDGNEASSDTFTYKVNDGAADSDMATVVIEVNPVNDAPVANDDAYTVNEGSTLSLGTSSILVNDTDAESAVLSAKVVDKPAHGTLILDATGSFIYIHNGSETTGDSFTYKANDGVVDSNLATVSITVNPVNDAPTAKDDSGYTAMLGDVLAVTAEAGVLVNDLDAEGDALTAVVVSQPAHGVLNLNTDGSFSYQHDGTTTSNDSFTYRASDGKASSNIAMVTLAIGTVENDAPVAVNDSYTVLQGGVLTDTAPGVLVNDLDADENDTLTAILVNSTSHGALTFNGDGSFTYIHNGDEAESDSFSYKVNDGSVDSNVAVASIAINTPENDPPLAANDLYYVDRGQTLQKAVEQGLLSNDEDPDGDTLTAILVTEPAHGTLSLNADGSFVYAHNGGDADSDSFTYKANDGELDSAVVEVTILVNNNAPVANDDTYETDRGTILSVTPANGVLANDSDSDNDSLTAILVSNPSHGTLTLNADGSFAYQHDGSETSTDSFIYKASDNFAHKTNEGEADSMVATVRITINQTITNQAPNAENDSYEVKQGQTLVVNSESGVLTNDTDPDNDTLAAVLVDGPDHGTLILNPNGSFTYEHNGGETSSDSFTYKANDGRADSPVATVQITINQTTSNQPPNAEGDSYEVERGKTLSVNIADGVLANDTDPDNDTLTAVLVNGPAHGTLTLDPDGSFTYEYNGNEASNDSFTYKANDGQTDSGIATVSITVNPGQGPEIYKVLLPLVLK